MTGDIVERLEAWARDTEQSWESIRPVEERGGCEYWRADKRDIDMVREAADAIRRLKEELRTVYDRATLAERERDEAQDERRHAVAALSEQLDKVRAERDEARQRTNSILTEIDCRIEHGAESNGHLEAIRSLFKGNNND